jgi:hypothetical protein
MFLMWKILRFMYLALAQNVRENKKNMIVIEQIKWGAHISFLFLKTVSQLLETGLQTHPPNFFRNWFLCANTKNQLL